MPMQRDDIEAALLRKGFQQNNTDHSYFHFYDKNGKKTIVNTKTSGGSKYKTLGPPLVSKMASQCKLTKPQFQELVECTLSHEKYEEILGKTGHI
jgi:predicted RNA binding protein YcfA (HicA-like mRNA interferase family)